MMNTELNRLADELVGMLEALPMVHKCTLCGSLAKGTADEISDIDIDVDVSGYDKGKFMLEVPELLRDKLNIVCVDFAPSLIPEKCIVSLSFDEQNPYRVVDINCCAEPADTVITADQARQLNNRHAHMIKLWTANWKHFTRGRECRGDILHMVQKIGISDAENKSDLLLLEETLCWLEQNAEQRYQGIIASCRRLFDQGR